MATLQATMQEMLELFGFFLLVLIGLELLTTLKAHLVKGVVHVEVVLEVALIAVAQKIIVLNMSKANALTLLGSGRADLALAIGFRLMRSARNSPKDRRDVVRPRHLVLAMSV